MKKEKGNYFIAVFRQCSTLFQVGRSFIYDVYLKRWKLRSTPNIYSHSILLWTPLPGITMDVYNSEEP